MNTAHINGPFRICHLVHSLSINQTHFNGVNNSDDDNEDESKLYTW